MAHVLSPKRTWVLLLPLFVHGLALTIGALVWFFFSVHCLFDETASARYVFRRPTSAEVAEGRVWFGAHTEARTVARPSEARSAFEPLSDDGTKARRSEDPWDGCSIRRQFYVSGKNSGWRDGNAWSYGAYLLHDPEGHEVRLPLSALTSQNRVVMTPEAREQMDPPAFPGEQANRKVPDEGGTEQFLRECFPETAELAVDGYVDEEHVVVRGVDTDPPARFESASRQRARARRTLVWQSFGLVAFGAPLMWLACFIAFVRQPFALRKLVAAVFPGDSKLLWKRALAAAGVGAILSAIAVCTGRVSPVVLVITTGLFGVAGLLGQALFMASSTLRTFERLLQSRGGPAGGASEACREGRLVAPEVPVVGRATHGYHAFAYHEAFELSAKGAVGSRVMVTSSHARLEAEDTSGRFFVETSRLEGVGSSDVTAEQRISGEGLALRGYDTSVFSPGKRYLLRETALAAGAPLTVLGMTRKEADPMARGEDYREAGQSTVFVPGQGNARGPLFFAHPADILLHQAQKDVRTFGVYRAFFALWALALPIPLVVSFLFGRAD